MTPNQPTSNSSTEKRKKTNASFALIPLYFPAEQTLNANTIFHPIPGITYR